MSGRGLLLVEAISERWGYFGYDGDGIRDAGAGPSTSVVVANAVATAFAYTGNRYWAFRHRKNARIGRETVLFIIFNVIGTLIQVAFVDFNHYLLHNIDRYSQLIATVIGIVFATVFRLFCYRKFVFSAVPATVEEAEERTTATLP